MSFYELNWWFMSDLITTHRQCLNLSFIGKPTSMPGKRIPLDPHSFTPAQKALLIMRINRKSVTTVLIGNTCRLVLVHRLVYALKSVSAVISDTHGVSHVCHNKRCHNYEHLPYETVSTNNMRKYVGGRANATNMCHIPSADLAYSRLAVI